MFNVFKYDNKALNFVIRNLAGKNKYLGFKFVHLNIILHTMYYLYISVADLFMAIYLIVICYHDQIYRNEYYLYAHKWESSNLCTMVGIMAVISSEVYLLFKIFIITLQIKRLEKHICYFSSQCVDNYF